MEKRKKLIFFSFFYFVMLLPLFGQQHDYIWTMGRDYDLSNEVIEGNILSFNSGILSISPDTFYIELHSTMANICDAQGNLQFYTNGCKIANWQHELIENGNGINPGEVHESKCTNSDDPWRGAYTAGNQSTMALPFPHSDSIYYLFHKGIEYIDGDVPTRPLYYSSLNMVANNGGGRVLLKNQIIIDEELHFGQLTAVKHANGGDWWVVTPGSKGNNNYFRFLFTENGIENVIEQNIGIPTTRTGGWANFSPDGTRYARYAPRNDDLFLFDFNRTTGELSNFQQIIIEEEEEWVGGVAFSPNSRFLYVSSFNFVYQFDTWADDIAASRITIAEYEPNGEFIGEQFWGIQLGPDCKMYVYCNSCDVIHVIHNPDEQGLACDFEQAGVQLPWPIFRSQPHFPNYRLGPEGDEGLPCSPVVSVRETVLPDVGLHTYPNPVRGTLTLSPQGISGEWGLYDGFGRLVMQHRLQSGREVRLSVANLPKGLYFWKIKGSFLLGKILVQ